ncbi:ABATE domain-containing protein [Rhizobium sp. AC27/96]|uniref:CGNR zinc finger domain-containing protein n=1 Tax=Rhizobium sp. AC27/96 TaxID=1841653 RepID=UPI0018E9DF23|nr:ABATE domain-containing protein [Rhizobium sp. AC27/96]
MTMRDETKRPEERDGFRFRGGHNALDLTATLAARLKPVPRERLAMPADLGRWFVAAGIVPSAPDVEVKDLEEARALREGIFAVSSARLSGEDAPSARKLLNDIAAKPSSVPQLDANAAIKFDGTVSALLSTVAREAILLLGGPQAGRVRQCESATCTIFFLDTSRAGDRRWCSMAGCGNQAKVREFRRRKAAS